MATSSSSPAPRRSVVRSLASAVDRPCARPGCPAPARATLTFSYATREATLDRLAEQDTPQGYDLCGPHAARTEAPRGWELADQRPAEDLAPPPPREDRELGGEATVAVLAAALRAVPPPEEEPAVGEQVAAAPGPPPIPDDAIAAAAAAEAAAPHAVTAAADTFTGEDTTEIVVPSAPSGPPRAPAVDTPPSAPRRTPRQVPAARDRDRG